MIVAVVVLDTVVVEIVKVALVAPAGTVTEAGTVALELLEERFTATPPVGAAPVRVTVPTEEAPPATVFGETVRLLSPTGLIVNVAVFWVLP